MMTTEFTLIDRSRIFYPQIDVGSLQINEYAPQMKKKTFVK